MRPLTLADIADLRAYEREREEFRRQVIALKRVRRVPLGPLASVVFENRTTVRFQVQEMARAERLRSDAEIEKELAVYNPLIPARNELSLTLLLELTTEEELREWLPKLVGIERSVGLRVGRAGEAQEVRATVDPSHEEHLTRDDVTASVHFLHIALDEETAARVRAEPVTLFSDHPLYRHETVLRPETTASLVADWDED